MSDPVLAKARIPMLVTGGAGMLGQAFASAANHFPGFEIKALSRAELDVLDDAALQQWRGWIAGGWIVHCAAMVNVARCEQEPQAARDVIVEGTRNVVRLARDSGARLLYPQSFLVYDAVSAPIPEDEEPRPLTFYGELKMEAERIVAESLADPLIVCMAGFFGGGAADKNFVGLITPVIRAAIERGDRSFAVGDRVWQPTWTNDLAANCLYLMDRGAAGRYQMASLGEAKFCEIAEIIVEELGWSDRIVIERISAAEIAKTEVGRRPDRAVLSCARLDRERVNLQRDWRATLKAYLADPFFDRFRLESVLEQVA